MRWATPELITVKSDFDFPSSTTARLKREGGGTFWSVGPHVSRWIEQNCVLTTAGFAGKPFKLLKWQKRWLAEVFEVTQDGESWRLKHRWVTLGIGKKNGKSELIGALALFFLIGTDENDPRIFAAASTEDQANMVFAPVKYIAENSPTIKGLVQAKARMVVSRTTRGGFIRRLAAVAGANDGANVYVALIDEFHEWSGQKGRDVWNVITNGTVMREEPMIIQITTAGHDQDTLCYEWYQAGIAQIDGSREDETAHFCWFQADPDVKDYRDPEYVRKPNPSFGVIMGPEFYADQLLRKTEAVYRRYFGNEWTESEEIWEAASKWPELAGAPRMTTDARTYVGVDIGRKIDNSAVTLVQLHDDPDGVRRAHVAQRIWSNPYNPGDSRYRTWRMNVNDVDVFLRDVYDTFPEPTFIDEESEVREPGPMFVYDPHLYGSHADNLRREGLGMAEFPQTDTRMVPASQLLYEWIMSSKVVHDGDPTASRHIRSVIAKEKERGWRISKPGASKHVDFAVSLAMALAAAVANEDEAVDGGETNIW